MSADEQAAQQAFVASVSERYGAQGMTQDQFARSIGVTAQAIRLWRRGARRVPRERVERAAEVLGCDPVDLWPGWQTTPPAPSRGGRLTPTDAERLAALEAEVAEQRAALVAAGILADGELTTSGIARAAARALESAPQRPESTPAKSLPSRRTRQA